MSKIFLVFILVLVTYTPAECGIFVPEELPSFLSLLYSIVPPLRIGKDSRFGAGFRIGPNADLQFLVELGPQTNTLPLGPPPSPDVDDTLPGIRRHVASSTSSPSSQSSSSSSSSRRRPSSSRNWGFNYIQPKRQKGQTNQTKSNNGKGITKSNDTKPQRPQQLQQNQQNILQESTTRRIIKLPDGLIVYNNTKQLKNNKNNTEATTGISSRISDINNNLELSTTKITSTTETTELNNNTINKNIELNANQILEETIKNSTIITAKNNVEKKQRNESRRPRVIRDWFLSWWDNLRTNIGGRGGTT